jgi:hypothetical protein
MAAMGKPADSAGKDVTMHEYPPMQQQPFMGMPDLPDWPDMPQPEMNETDTVLNEYELVEKRILSDFCKFLAEEIKTRINKSKI